MPDSKSEERSIDDRLRRRLRIADLVVDLGQASVSRDGELVPLPGLSFDLLVVLARAAPDLVTHDALMDRVWRGTVVSPETVSQRVKLLRDALGDDPREPRYVAGVRGRGYRLIPPVVADSSAIETAPEPESAPALAPAPIAVSAPGSGSGSTTVAPTRSGVAFLPGRRARLAWGAASFGAAVLLVALALQYRSGRDDGLDAGNAGPSVTVAPAGSSANGASVAVVGLAPRTVAVLPFQNFGADADDRYIGRGVAEMVLNRLAASPALFVVARSSSFAFEERNLDAREIGRQLGARFLIQGSVQRSDRALRVTAQLVDAQSGRQVQTLRLDRPMADLFAVQDEIAAGMASALDVAVADSAGPPRRLDAHLEYLQGLSASGRFRVAEFEAAIRHFARARELDPGFAAVYAAESRARLRLAAMRGLRFSAVAADITPLIARALALDPQLGAAYIVRGMLDPAGAAAEADLRRGVALAPNDAEGYFELGQRVAQDAARYDEGMELIERAMLLDPLQPRYRYVATMNEFRQDKDIEAYRARLLEVLKIDPAYTQALTRLAGLEADSVGRVAQGIVLIERALRLDPASAFIRQRAAGFYVKIGDNAAAADALGFAAAGSMEQVAVLLQRGDRSGALDLARAIRDSQLNGRGGAAAYVAASLLRDDALRTRDLERGSQRLVERYCELDAPDPRCASEDYLPVALLLAHLELRLGDAARGRDALRRLAERTQALEAERGRRSPYFDTLLAMAQSLLGRRDEALLALASAQRGGGVWNGWYVLEGDIVFDAVDDDPRFAALRDAHRAQMARERMLLETQRRNGDVPRRPPTSRATVWPSARGAAPP